MRKLFLLLMAAWLVLGCGEGQEYGQVLDRAERQNRNWDSITGIDSIRMAVGYVDRHGSANEQVRAHYLLGCAYRDAGDALKALEAYHDAADCADTTRADCDYGLLIRVYGQSSDLFKRQLLPDEMLTELEAQRRYALRIGDMRVAINALERSSDAYYLMARKDSVIPIRRRASAQYEQYGFPEEAAQTLSPCIEPLVDRGDTAAARRCIERYESSKAFFVDGEILPRKAVHYYNKGRYCLAVGKTDSAEVYFRKLLRPDLAPDQLEAGYHGLFLLYKQQRGPADSIAKYGELQYDQNNLVMAATNAERVQQMQALYNYTHFQQSEEQMRAEVRIRGWIIAVIVLVFIICLMIGFGLWKRRQWQSALVRLPEVLSTDEAMALWRKAQEAGFVDASYQPLISRTQSALLADAMAERLGIREKWKVFETLWNRNNMRSDYNQALSQRQTLAFQDRLKKLIT
jgi:tetratricopeptide (TPR) repeat protein